MSNYIEVLKGKLSTSIPQLCNTSWIHLYITCIPETPLQVIGENSISVSLRFGLDLRKCPLVNVADLPDLNPSKRFSLCGFFTMP